VESTTRLGTAGAGRRGPRLSRALTPVGRDGMCALVGRRCSLISPRPGVRPSALEPTSATRCCLGIRLVGPDAESSIRTGSGLEVVETLRVNLWSPCLNGSLWPRSQSYANIPPTPLSNESANSRRALRRTTRIYRDRCTATISVAVLGPVGVVDACGDLMSIATVCGALLLGTTTGPRWPADVTSERHRGRLHPPWGVKLVNHHLLTRRERTAAPEQLLD